MPDQATSGHRSRVVTGSLWTSLAFGGAVLNGAILTIVLVRTMSHRDYGTLTVDMAAVSILGVVVSLGLDSALSQVAVSERVRNGLAGQNSAIRSAVVLAVIGSIAAVPLLGLTLLGWYLIDSLRPGVVTLLALAPVAVLAPFVAAASGTLRALGRPRQLALRGFLASMLGSLAIVALVVSGFTKAYVVGIARGCTALITLSLVGAPVVSWYRERRPIGGVPATTQRLVKFGSALVLGSLFTIVLSRLAVLLLGALYTSRLAGLYAPTATVSDLVVSVPVVIGYFYLPTVTELASSGNSSGVSSLYRFGTRWSIAITSPALGLIVVCPGSVLKLLFGAGFSQMAGPLRVLGYGALTQVLTGFNGLTLDAFGLPNVVVVRQVVSLGITIIASSILVPQVGAIGAATATSIGFASANALCSATLFWRFRIHPFDSDVLKTSLALAAGLGLSWFAVSPLGDELGRCVVASAVTGSITIIAAIVAGGRQERMAIVQHLFPRRRLERNARPW